jgi:hypothetical protein
VAVLLVAVVSLALAASAAEAEADMTDQPSPQSEPNQLQLGSSVVPLYVERRMKVYAITDSEFSSVSMLNAQTTTFFSIGLAILSAAVSIWINAVFYADAPPAAVVAQKYVAPCGVLLALSFFWLAFRAIQNRQSTWERIKEESASLATPGNV